MVCAAGDTYLSLKANRKNLSLCQVLGYMCGCGLVFKFKGIS